MVGGEGDGWFRVHAQNTVLYTLFAVLGVTSPCLLLNPVQIEPI